MILFQRLSQLGKFVGKVVIGGTWKPGLVSPCQTISLGWLAHHLTPLYHFIPLRVSAQASTPKSLWERWGYPKLKIPTLGIRKSALDPLSAKTSRIRWCFYPRLLLLMRCFSTFLRFLFGNGTGWNWSMNKKGRRKTTWEPSWYEIRLGIVTPKLENTSQTAHDLTKLLPKMDHSQRTSEHRSSNIGSCHVFLLPLSDAVLRHCCS